MTLWNLLKELGDDRTGDAALRFGIPGHCPTCYSDAHIVTLDLDVRASQHQCSACASTWWVSEARPGTRLLERPTSNLRHTA